ncbi:MAG TPA: SDR family NAD(P)-dependent oxidoreductase [Phycisphaerales bacterium]|nr:SDR family NAD(P)-dependent oxidoreductase [Phycisphaerales bacterium]
MDLSNRTAVVTGAASGIARAVCTQLGREGIRAIACVDFSDNLADACREINAQLGRECLIPFKGDVTDRAFRRSVFDEMTKRVGGVSICVPAAGIVRDGFAIRLDKETKKASLYDQDLFEKTVAVNLIAASYWAMETMASVAEQRAKKGLSKWTPDQDLEGAIVFIGSISSEGNKGQVSYSSTKAGLIGVCSTLAKEAIFQGVRVGIVHPGFTDTPMVRKMDPKIISEHVLPNTQLGRLLTADEIADAICFMIRNPAVSGSIWADAGWHPRA